MTDMLRPVSLSREAEPTGRDAAALYGEALEQLRQLAGRTWTDHNLHDPGITLLEIATWALAELGYRADLPLEDLLTPPAGSLPGLADQFLQARRVLPMRPLTARDWRKRLIDLPGVKNAWVQPVTPAPLYADLLERRLRRHPPAHGRYREVRLRGLVRVLIDCMDGLDTQAEREPVLRAVRAALEAGRNLCEDFVAVDIIPTQSFALCAEVDLEPAADLTETAAQLLFTAARWIAPPVPAHRLGELLARPGPDGLPRSPDQIFDGPLPDNGFIDDAELALGDLPAELHLSDLINVLMDVPGVRALPDLLLTPVDGDGFGQRLANPWRIPVTPGHLPRLALGTDGPTAGRLVFRKRGLPVAGWNLDALPGPVTTLLAELQKAARLALETPDTDDLPVPPGRHREVATWRSLQLDFPPLYGLDESGLAGNPDPQRQAQVLQLKAWLSFFDQQIANDLALLGQARERLSMAPSDLAATAARFNDPSTPAQLLVGQRVDSIPGHARIYTADVSPALLAGLMESPAEAVARQQRLQDHLLARLGEDFSDYAGAMASAFGHSDARVIADKSRFLADAPEVVGQRAGAYHQAADAPEALWNSFNVSGLEIRLARLLGIADFSRRNLGTVSYDTYAEIDATPGDEFRFRVLRAGDDKILLSSTGNFTTREAARARMIEAIERGQRSDDGHYRIIQGSDGRFYFSVQATDGHLLARRAEGFASRDAALAEIATLAAYLRDHYSGEGLYVIENLLLRPTLQRQADGSWAYTEDPADSINDDPFLPICVDPACVDCGDDDPCCDPYSQRLQIVLPAYAGRFQDPDFRDFVEHTIRQEVPAHLLPKVCWVGSDHMARFEGAYRDWIRLHAGTLRPDRASRHAILQAMVDALTEMKNQYPRRTLFDCVADAPRPPFVLGRHALGSAPDQNLPQEPDNG